LVVDADVPIDIIGVMDAIFEDFPVLQDFYALGFLRVLKQ
jgi:hypothetical protein